VEDGFLDEGMLLACWLACLFALLLPACLPACLSLLVDDSSDEAVGYSPG